MKVYWHQCGHGQGNLGDRLTPLLLRYFNIPFHWSRPEEARLFGIGSILQRVPQNYDGTIWSSGLLEPKSNIDLSKARILALRGKLTLNQLTPPGTAGIPLGDGGLLSHLFHKPAKQRFKLGIIPHYADANSAAVTRLNAISPEIKVIDICEDLPEVIRSISECQGILSSSLHGLIIADALHHPNRWIELEPGKVLGEGFKFRDYYSAFGIDQIAPAPWHDAKSLDDLMPLLNNCERPGLDQIQGNLLENVRSLAGDTRHWHLGQLPMPERERTVTEGSQSTGGRPLSEEKDTVTRDPDALGQFFIGCLEILADLRERGIAHRDIQLKNISLINDHPVLRNFGWVIPEACVSKDSSLFRRDLRDMAAVFDELNPFDRYKTVIHLMPELDLEPSADTIPALIDLVQSAKNMKPVTTSSTTPRQRQTQHGEQNPLPVPFIVGTGRCGTTLLRLMLDSHPDLAIPPETHFIPTVTQACGHSDTPAKTFIETIRAHRTWPDFHLDADALQEKVEQLNPFSIGDALRLFFQTYASRFNKPRWGEKTPIYSSHMRSIQTLLPEAHFIHLVRDGRDVALSVKEVFFGPKATRDAGQWWAHGIREAHYQAQQLKHYMELRYEDLVLEPELHLKKICGFLQLPWDPAMLEYYKRSSSRLGELEQIKNGADADQRRGIHQWTHKPPQASRLARWKKEMAEKDRQEFESEAGEVLSQMGYELSTNVTPAPPTAVWMEQVDRATEELRRLIPSNQSFIFVDQAELGDLDLNGNRQTIPFPNQNGDYWGPPEDDGAALAELERLRRTGASHFVVAWPAFWWLDHYREFAQELGERFPRVVDNPQLIAFELQPGGGTQ